MFFAEGILAFGEKSPERVLPDICCDSSGFFMPLEKSCHADQKKSFQDIKTLCKLVLRGWKDDANAPAQAANPVSWILFYADYTKINTKFLLIRQ